MGANDSFTIDELARAADMTPRNVRAYRTKGLLSPPVREGRSSRYRSTHLHRLRDIRQLREAGLPLKLIIEAARRGEDLGPEGMLWLAAGRMRERHRGVGGTAVQTPSFVVDPQAYALMQTLARHGFAPTTVMLLALQAARASTALATELIGLLAADPQALAAHHLPAAKTDVIDLATVITREMLGHTLAGPHPTSS